MSYIVGTNISGTGKNITIERVYSNMRRAIEYQGNINDMGPGEIDIGNGDSWNVYHYCDRVRNERALDNLEKLRNTPIKQYKIHMGLKPNPNANSWSPDRIRDGNSFSRTVTTTTVSSTTSSRNYDNRPGARLRDNRGAR